MNIEFALPPLLAGVPVLLALAVLWYIGRARNRRRGRTLSRVAMPPGPRFAPALLALIGIVALVAAAQPRWGTRISSLPRNGAELVIVLDVSRSMDAKDIAPSRIEATKAALLQTLDRVGGDRVGLVIFAGSARLRMPLTSDLSAARHVIRTLETGPVLLETGTAASAGLDLALSAFDFSREAGRVVLLISDGDDLGGDPLASLQRLRESGVDLIVAGAGTAAGAPVPVYDPRLQKQADKLGADGNPIITRLNEDFLRVVAAAGGGRYLGSDLGIVPGAVQAKLAARQQVIVDEQESRLPVERFQLFAAIALAGIVVVSIGQQIFARLSPRSLAVGTTLAAFALLPGCASRAYTLNEQARSALESGDTARAIELFLEARAQTPGDGRIGLNLATVYNLSGQHEDAKQAANRVLLSRDDHQVAAARALIGRADFALEDLPAALQSFKQALVLNADDSDIRHDYEVVLRLLQEQQDQGEQPEEGQQQPVPTPPPGEGGEPSTPASPTGGQPGDPQPGKTPTPAPGQPPGKQPGPGTSTAPGQPAANGTDAQSPEALDRAIRELDRQVHARQLEAGEDPTTAEAIAILRLLAERSRLSAQRDAFSGNANPRDY